ncbi:YegS/Rv2252/BmrU family lipid kinase [Virgibacillus dakarensis]|uniref:Lipid kinase BmrU n=1 Tax=Lentibacillus populi TaxID=1827502 RepID=A0A9W5X7D5_9BACI|nr:MULTISPECIES: YegS/Rv2252/BmrU family lipid kinase [Bacillaceae]MBT2218323.1 YegS/Rv2252/BmrU family lipid kinase [Virgibacillus dakarensis]MTW85679.1 YegS/Rv2252/BmrU family lipid kinase [Virgibacillus dakarensis]GGB55610.1 putative lipid kinase BmrU [Lentibacillus populi]
MNVFKKALFLYNGNAGSDDIEQKLSATLPILTQSVKELTVVQTKTIEEAKSCCTNVADKVDLIIILGGDGTVHECMNRIAVKEHRPAIAILPGGTCNDFSRMLNIPQNLRQAAEAIVNGEMVEIDVGESMGRYFLNFWGIGLVSETSQNIDENQKKSFGVLSYFISTLKTVNQAETFSYQIKTGDEQYTGDAVMLLVLNGKFIGTRQLPVSTIDPADGKLDVLIVKKSAIAAFRELLMMNNSNYDNEQLTAFTHFQTNELTINTDTGKEIDMDGEINGTTPAEIRLLPRHIKMVGGRGTY